MRRPLSYPGPLGPGQLPWGAGEGVGPPRPGAGRPRHRPPRHVSAPHARTERSRGLSFPIPFRARLSGNGSRQKLPDCSTACGRPLTPSPFSGVTPRPGRTPSREPCALPTWGRRHPAHSGPRSHWVPNRAHALTPAPPATTGCRGPRRPAVASGAAQVGHARFPWAPGWGRKPLGAATRLGPCSPPRPGRRARPRPGLLAAAGTRVGASGWGIAPAPSPVGPCPRAAQAAGAAAGFIPGFSPGPRGPPHTRPPSFPPGRGKCGKPRPSHRDRCGGLRQVTQVTPRMPQQGSRVGAGTGGLAPHCRLPGCRRRTWSSWAAQPGAGQRAPGACVLTLEAFTCWGLPAAGREVAVGAQHSAPPPLGAPML